MNKSQTLADSFHKQFDLLQKELLSASTHLYVAQCLKNSIAEFESELNEAPLFWGHTIQAHYVAALAALCRVFDTDPAGTHLPRLLKDIQENLPAFDAEQFRQRYSHDPLRMSFFDKAGRPDSSYLARDIAFCSDKRAVADPAVTTLRKWRNNALAHTNQQITAGTLRLEESDPLRIENLQKLVDGGYEILNYYSTLFQGMDYSGFLPEHLDDYKFMLAALKRGYAASNPTHRRA